MNTTKNPQKHPLAGKTMMGADIIVQVLADEMLTPYLAIVEEQSYQLMMLFLGSIMIIKNQMVHSQCL